MKKIFAVMILLLVLMGLFVGLASEGIAQDATDVVEPVQVLPANIATEPPEENGYGWGYLGTIAGATAAVLLIVQYSKAGIDKIGHIPTRLYVYVLAVLILFAAKFLGGKFYVGDIPLILLNSVMVATAAMGSYEVMFSRATKT